MKNKYKNAKFRTKIMCAFLMIFIVSSLITGVGYYQYSGMDIVKNYRKNSADMVLQLNRQMEEEFAEMASKIDALCNNPSFSGPLNLYLNSADRSTDAVLSGEIADALMALSMGDKLVGEVYIYTSKRLFVDYTRLPIEGARYEDTEMYRHFVYYPNENVAWFPAMEDPLFVNSEKIIPVVYRRTVGGHTVYFVANIYQSTLTEYFRESYQSFENIFIVNWEGKEVVNFDGQAEKVLEQTKYEVLRNKSANSLTADINGKKYLVTGTQMTGSEWKLYALTSVESLTQNTKKLYLFILGMLAVSVLCAAFVIRKVTGQITRPLEELARTMDHTVEENLGTEFEYVYEDEIGVLARNYNRMLERIQGYIAELKAEKEQVRLVQKQKRKAELSVLQAQINPHFLYNTLNMITWQAVEQGAEEISTISNALGKYFRISLSRGRESIQIQEEAEHVKSYLDIQKIRYRNKLNYEIELPEEILNCYIIKLILQPLVENALYHGIKEKDTDGWIQIYAGTGESEETGRYIEIIVEDDGGGIPPERLDVLNERLCTGTVDSDSGYGIYNVNNRLRLYYGEEFGLKLESDYGEGTRAIVRIPLLKTKEQAEHVSNRNS